MKGWENSDHASFDFILLSPVQTTSMTISYTKKSTKLVAHDQKANKI